jgi:hypothetical protein
VIQYRVYVLDKNDHIVRRIDLEAEGDTGALDIAQQYVDGHDIELWQGYRIIRRLKSKPT